MMWYSRFRQLLCAGPLLVTSPLLAQLSSSPPSRELVRARLTTPAEHARGLRLYPYLGLSQDEMERIPGAQFDSIQTGFDALLRQRVRQWIASLQGERLSGIQLDPMGELYATIGRDSLAREQFAKRLATPRLSVADRAFTLLVAVKAFGGAPGDTIRAFGHLAVDTIRMKTALVYLAQLDALPMSAVLEKFHAHALMGKSYYFAGDAANASAQLQHALTLVPNLPFAERLKWSQETFMLLADVLSGQPRGRSQIDSIANWVLPHFQASRELVAKDSGYYWQGQDNTRRFKETLQMTGYLGRPAPPVVAHYWWNMPAPTTPSVTDSGAMIANIGDGKIRVIEFGHLGCIACMLALPKLDHWRVTAPPNVKTLYVTHGSDTWGADPCRTTDECAEHFRNYYLNRKKLGVPIAMWMGRRVRDVDGGGLLQESPTFTALATSAVPLFMITDGRGIVRHLSLGYAEPLIERTVKYLVAEAARSSQVPSSSSSHATP
jgi:hypothetical protein